MIYKKDIITKYDKEKCKFRLVDDCSLVILIEDPHQLDKNLIEDLKNIPDIQFSSSYDMIEFKIPKNFLTDFGSIPAPFKPFFNPIGIEVPAYVIHDYLCSLSNKGVLKRITADETFRLALQDMEEVSKYREFCLYWGARGISLYRKFFPFKKK